MRLAFLRTGSVSLGDCYGLDHFVARDGKWWHSAIQFTFGLVPNEHIWFTALPRKGVCWERLGNVGAYDMLNVPVTPEQELAAHRFAVSQIGRPYDWRGMLGVGNGNGAYCTEVVVETMQAIGLFPDLEACKQHAAEFYAIARKTFEG